MAHPDFQFDVGAVPFSRAGAYQSFSRLSEPAWWFHRGAPQLVWRNLHGGAVGTLAELRVLRAGREVPFSEQATPEQLTLKPKSGRGWIEISFADSSTVRFRGSELGLRLKTPKPGNYDQIQPADGRDWRLNFSSCKSEIRFSPKDGLMKVDAPWDGVKCEHISLDFLPEQKGGTWETTARETRWVQERREPVQVSWEKWLSQTPKVPQEFAATRELAAYVTWSALVDPHGHFQRPTIYMSKNWMTNIWSWDHCFNAIALARHQPALAWDQFMCPFDFQVTTGQLPDCVSDGSILWNFVKPPIHGWALSEMMRRTTWIGRKQLLEIYPKLKAWTNWWFQERDSDGDGLPQYNHGNDSGWDNATCFKVGMPVEGPELVAFLVLQMDMLADVAERIGRKAEARRWASRSTRLLEKLLEHNWRGDHFVATRSGDHAVHASDSLIPFIPLILGKKLPPEVHQSLLTGLTQKGRFLTPHGLATESPASAQYEPDGYWRGPIWAPPVFLLVSGLEKIGERSLAKTIAERFCRTCRKSGMAENFDARTGKNLRDPAYTWTASVFLLLASEWL